MCGFSSGASDHHLKEIPDVDEEGGRVGRHLHPGVLAATVRQENLQAVDVVGTEDAEDLRVSVLAEPDGTRAFGVAIAATC
jgi:hypothetical protein